MKDVELRLGGFVSMASLTFNSEAEEMDGMVQNFDNI